MIYEMIYIHTPFQAEYTSKIFQHIMASEKYLVFKGSPDPHFETLVRGLLCSNPSFRLGNLSSGINGLIDSPFFADLDWKAVYNHTAHAPYVPPIKDASDSSNFGSYEEEKNIPIYTGTQEHFRGF